MVPHAEAGPLYGMVCPTFISVSLTPGPYGPPAKANRAARMKLVANRPVNFLLFVVMRLSFPSSENATTRSRIEQCWQELSGTALRHLALPPCASHQSSAHAAPDTLDCRPARPRGPAKLYK